jgi:hypothetical protein
MAESGLALSCQFADDKSLVAVLGPTLSIVRATPATYFDSNGVMQTASANEARFDHTPFTGATSLGLLVEPAATNVGLQSEAIDYNQTPWSRGAQGTTVSANAATAPDGNTTAELVGFGIAFDMLRQDVVVTAATNYRISVFVTKAPSGAANYIRITTNNGAAWNTGHTTKVALTSAWQKIELTSQVNTTKMRTLLGRVQLDGSDDADCAGNVLLWGFQVELLNTLAGATSYIKTTTVPVTRDADVVTTTTVDWFNPNAGTFYLRGSFPYADTAALKALTLDDGGTTDRFYVERDAAQNINFATVNSGDTNGASDGAGVIAAATEFIVAAAYADDDVIAAIDGTLSAPDSAAAIPLGDSMTALRIGADSAGNYFNGHIAEVRYYDERKRNFWLQNPDLGVAGLVASLATRVGLLSYSHLGVRGKR